MKPGKVSQAFRSRALRRVIALPVLVLAATAAADGTFHRGQAHFNGQFLVFNTVSGDPSAAHEQTTVSLRR